MDTSLFLGALAHVSKIEKVFECDCLKLYRCRTRTLFSETFYMGFTDLFYLPENEHRLREAVASFDFPKDTNRVLILCSYNGMTLTKNDDLSSVTEKALILYLLFERETEEILCPEGFTRGDRLPSDIARLFSRALREQSERIT